METLRRTHDEVLSIIRQKKLVAILRGVPVGRLDGVVGALIRGGVGVLEFTFDHRAEDCVAENTEKIRRAVAEFGSRIVVGCGTALTETEVEAAYAAGAELVVSPDTNPAVIARTRALGMVSMPGAMTPTEIVAAWHAGADIVKLFPAGELGVPYIKAILGPLSHIPMSAVGGVKPENAADFLDAGVCGFGIGSQLVLPGAVKSGDDAALEAQAKRFVNAIAAWEAGR